VTLGTLLLGFSHECSRVSGEKKTFFSNPSGLRGIPGCVGKLAGSGNQFFGLVVGTPVFRRGDLCIQGPERGVPFPDGRWASIWPSSD